MLREIAEKLDRWAAAQNESARATGMLGLKPCRIQLVGQMELFELQTKLPLAVTNDVDVRDNCEHAVRQEFARLLRSKGKTLDPLGDEVAAGPSDRFMQLARSYRLDMEQFL